MRYFWFIEKKVLFSCFIFLYFIHININIKYKRIRLWAKVLLKNKGRGWQKGKERALVQIIVRKHRKLSMKFLLKIMFMILIIYKSILIEKKIPYILSLTQLKGRRGDNPIKYMIKIFWRIFAKKFWRNQSWFQS